MTSSEAHDLFQTADRWLKEREQGSHYLDTSRLETAQAKKTEKNANNFFFSITLLFSVKKLTRESSFTSTFTHAFHLTLAAFHRIAMQI
jgi:hypothetical protein